MDAGGLSRLIERYEYGQFSILDNGMRITHNREEQKVKFDPFYHFDSRTARGSCGELMSAAYLEIREKHPELHVTRALGNDPDFFRDWRYTHCFLFVSERDLMKGLAYTYEPKNIEEAVSQNPLVVDPSFHRVVRYSGSGYKAQKLFNQGCEVAYSNALVLGHRQGVPLGINSQGGIVYLMVNFDSPELIDIGVQEPGEDIRHHGLNSRDLDRLFGDDPNILRFVDLLRRREKSETRQQLKAENSVIIG